MSEMKKVYYTEHLTFYSWVFSIFIFFLKNRQGFPGPSCTLYYFDSSRLGRLVARCISWLVNVRSEELDFSISHFRDEEGTLFWKKMMFDLPEVQEAVKHNREFQRAVQIYGTENQLGAYLYKQITSCDLIHEQLFVLTKLLFLIKVVALREKSNNSEPVLFLQERPWFNEIEKYARKSKLTLFRIKEVHFDIKNLPLRSHRLKTFVKTIIYYGRIIKYYLRRSRKKNDGSSVFARTRQFQRKNDLTPKMAVEYYGNLNLNNPEQFSELFFYSTSKLSGENILLYFNVPFMPVTNEIYETLKEHKVSAVAMNRLAALTPEVPVFQPRRKNSLFNIETMSQNVLNQKWLDYNIRTYRKQLSYWSEFFVQNNIKMHVAWFKFNSEHYAILDALKANDGIGIMYQRSFEHFPVAWAAHSADVYFGFSQSQAHLGQDKSSVIPYYVVTGYLGDYRFETVRTKAAEIRNRLKARGAEKILAYFDENCIRQSKWDTGYKIMLDSYAFLFKKIIDHPWLGLILKPKVPSTLRKVLSPIAELLAKAEKTGRCILLGEGTFHHTSYPPAIVSLGADIAIHGFFSAATAGIESALTGTPTLYLDAEGYPANALTKLGYGRVIFKNWDDLWRTLTDHWKTPQGVPGFADWSCVIDEVDPFRDGRAAERMGMYLQWLMEGFKDKLPRETVLADAAERYAKIWGKDKIFSVNFNHQNQFYSPAEVKS